MSVFERTLLAGKIHTDLSAADLRSLAAHHETTASTGAARYITKIRNRSAKNTYIVEDGVEVGVRQQPISLEKATAIAKDVRAYLADKEMIQVDRNLGLNDEWRLGCRLMISKPYARIAYMWHQSLFPPAENFKVDYLSIYVPEWPEKIMFAHPTEGVTFILGSDYFGESKKSFLRMAMFNSKERGGLGLHAGSKVIRVKNPETQEVEDKGFLLFGLSGTGKTTLTVHDCGLKAPEGVVIRQDDVVLLTPDAKAIGTEDGFFIKTEGLDPSQEVLYQAAIRDDAIFENVTLDNDNTPDFDDVTLTSNGRGIILRKYVGSTDDSVDLETVDKMVFITRRDDIIPPLARLNATQAAAFFMLGESIETSAGDPTKAGQAKREVGTNPFIIGPEAEEGNRLLRLLEENPEMECFLMNTGSVGKRDGSLGVKCKVHHSTGLLREIARGNIKYEIDPFWGYEVAVDAGDLNLSELDPKRYFNREELTQLNQDLKDERVAWLEQFPGLEHRILETITSAGM